MRRQRLASIQWQYVRYGVTMAVSAIVVAFICFFSLYFQWRNDTGIHQWYFKMSKGYGTDTLHALLRFLFLKMNLNRVQLDTWSGNTRAIRAYEKCGFVLEGRLRQNEYIDGQYHDTILMGLLREDYLQIK